MSGRWSGTRLHDRADWQQGRAGQLTEDGKGPNGAHAGFMLHHAPWIRHPHHDLLEALGLQDEWPVLLAEGQVTSCLQGLALHIVGPTAYQLLHHRQPG